MTTNNVRWARQVCFVLLLVFSALNLFCQKLPDFGVKLKKGDFYYLDYQVSNVYRLPIRTNIPAYHSLDTHAIVKKLIRIEVVEELPDQQYLLTASSERTVSKYKFGDRLNVIDDTYRHPFERKGPFYKNNRFGFGALMTLTSYKGRIQNPIFTHIRVDANLSVLKLYQSEEEARLDKGRVPQKPAHLWLDFDKIGIFIDEEQADLLPYITPVWEKETPQPHPSPNHHYLQFTASYIDALTVDAASGWLSFAQFTDKKEGKWDISLIKTIKGWKGETRKRTLVEGYLKQVKGAIRKENLTEFVPYYFDKNRENISIDEKGFFRWEGYLDQSSYFSLSDLAGDDQKKIYCYVQPGDSLYIEGDFSSPTEKVAFKGRNQAANRFLNQNGSLPLPGLTEWLGQITVPVNKWEQGEVNELVVIARQKSLERLKQQKDRLDPRFYQDEYWRLTYSLSRFIRPSSPKEEPFKKEKFLPLLNMQAEHLPAYWSYIEYFAKQQAQQNQFNNLVNQPFNFHERYNSAKLFLAGFPQHILMYHTLQEALHHKKVSQEEVAFMENEFLSICADESLTAKIRFLSNRLEQTAPGHYFLNLQLLDTLGNRLEMKDFMGKKVVLEPVFRVSGGYGAKNYKEWQEKHPDLLFMKLALFEKPTDFSAYKEAQMLQSSPDVAYYFPANGEERAKAYRFLALDSLHRYARYPKFFLLDEKGKIIKQDYLSFDENLVAFAQLPSAIVPIWKNPIWKAALLLGLISGFLTWVVLHFIGRVKEKNLERQRHMVEMELNSIRSQLNPHFVYNTMSSIQNLILSDRSEQASQYLAELAGLMRAVLNQTKKGIISLEEELATIRQYCKLEALRKSFAWNIKVDQSVDLHNTDIPALLLQPYVENAIIHGLRGKEEDGKIDLTITQKNGSLDIIIQDNGVGIAENQHRSLGGNHLGLHLNRKRLELLYGKLARVIIQDLNHLKKGKTGTQVAINIPI